MSHMMGDSNCKTNSLALEACGLVKHYGVQAALDHVDLSLGKMERLAVLGPNGSGKTTLISVLSTVIRASAGSLRVMGYDSTDAPNEVRRHIGVVAHQTYLYEELSTLENLIFYGRLFGIPKPSTRAEFLLDLVDMYTRRHDQVGSLSHGMQQRVALARALIHDPDILLLDEPDSGLDQEHLDLLASLVTGTKIPPRAVILTTHNLSRGLDLCQRVVVLIKGQIAYQAQSASLDRTALLNSYRNLSGAMQ